MLSSARKETTLLAITTCISECDHFWTEYREKKIEAFVASCVVTVQYILYFIGRKEKEGRRNGS